MWNIANQEIAKDGTNFKNIQINNNGKILSDADELANIFNYYYIQM